MDTSWNRWSQLSGTTGALSNGWVGTVSPQCWTEGKGHVNIITILFQLSETELGRSPLSRSTAGCMGGKIMWKIRRNTGC